MALLINLLLNILRGRFDMNGYMQFFDNFFGFFKNIGTSFYDSVIYDDRYKYILDGEITISLTLNFSSSFLYLNISDNSKFIFKFATINLFTIFSP